LIPERLEEIWQPYRHELRRDYVALSELIRRVRRVDPELDDRQVRETTLEVLRCALVRGEAEAGQFEEGEFVPWGEPPGEVVRRAAVEWDELGGKDPTSARSCG